MEKRYYIAYGSNLNIRQMYRRCPEAGIIGTSMIEGYELLFKGSMTGAYLTIEKKDGGRVPVAVWAVTSHDEKALDCYEGYPRFYYKTEMTLPVRGIRSGRVRSRRCFVYIMHEDRQIGVPSYSYAATCLEGYGDFGFDEHYLDEARIKAEEAVRHEGRRRYDRKQDLPKMRQDIQRGSGPLKGRQQNADLSRLRDKGGAGEHRC